MLKKIAISLTLIFFATALHSQSVPEGFSVNTITSVQGDAVGFALLPDGRILVVNQFSGTVQVIVNGNLSSALYTVSNLATSFEKGLLGIAVDPAFPKNPYIYMFHSHDSGTNRVSRFTVSGDLNDPDSDDLDIGSPLLLLGDMPANASNHNGGTVRFGTDGTLFISHGDDASRSLVQDLTTLNGKILRINPDGTIPSDNPTFPNEPEEKRDEIFAFGFRNPFRFSIDSSSGDLFVGDVGEQDLEEVDQSSGGENFGWPRREGSQIFDQNASIIQPTPTDPIHEYAHISGGNAVAVLLVYRQQNFPEDFSFPSEYDGVVFFADFYRNSLNYLTDNDGEWESSTFGTGYNQLSDGALAPDGSIFVLEYGFALSQITYNPLVPVEMVSFTANQEPGRVVLWWTTASEHDNFGFEVQKKSETYDFKKIGFVQGQGTTTVSTQYSFADQDIRPGTFEYRLKQIDTDGSFEFSGIISITITTPGTFSLSQNYPNPFNPSTTITYELPVLSDPLQSLDATLVVYNLQGEKVATLLNRAMTPGKYTAIWNGLDNNGHPAANGIYIYKLTYGSFTQSHKMLLVR